MSDYPIIDMDCDLPLFRESDPQTSKDAAANVMPTLATKAGLMFESIRLLARLRSPTANEAAHRCACEHGGIAETYRKRIGQLESDTWIVSDGSRKCLITGVTASTYRPRR